MIFFLGSHVVSITINWTFNPTGLQLGPSLLVPLVSLLDVISPVLGVSFTLQSRVERVVMIESLSILPLLGRLLTTAYIESVQFLVRKTEMILKNFSSFLLEFYFTVITIWLGFTIGLGLSISFVFSLSNRFILFVMKLKICFPFVGIFPLRTISLFTFVYSIKSLNGVYSM